MIIIVQLIHVKRDVYNKCLLKFYFMKMADWYFDLVHTQLVVAKPSIYQS